MARQSFRLRRSTSAGSDTVNFGSFTRTDLQVVTGAGFTPVDDDGSLRSTNLVLATVVNEESFFEANVNTYETVEIRWGLTSAVKTIADITAQATPTGINEIKVVCSTLGFPESANEGTVVFKASAEEAGSQDLATVTITHNPGVSGRWVYYSLFARYYQVTGGTGSYWYERLGYLEVLVPENYGSTNKLWNRVPQYYRDLDTSKDLYNYLDVFGFEIDRTRSLIQSVFTSKDPALAEAETVEQLANLVGLEVNVADIGVARTRALLHDIGYLRRQKGTYNGIVGYLKALSGANVDFAKISGTWTATIYAQRANLVGDPLFKNAGNYTVTAQTGSPTVTTFTNGIAITTSASATKVAIQSNIAVPITTGVQYYTSATFSASGSGASFNVYGGTTASASTAWSDWSAPTWTAQGEIPVSGTDYVNRRVFASGTASASGSKFPVLLVEVAANTTLLVSKWMLEPNNYGPYFDGSSDFGGFLYQNNYNDHTWSGTTNGSYSVFTVQAKRTREAIKKVCASIMPITLDFDPSTDIRWDWIPGKT